METVEQKKQKNKNITKENNLDLSQYETIPALDEALGEPDEQPSFRDVDELFDYIHSTWDED